jgi:sugar fermentation stimulation protein A
VEVHFPFTKPVARGAFLRRYKRFFADVEVAPGQPGLEEFGGRVVTVHCANSGSMKTCGEAGWPALISDSGNPERKLRHSLELVQCPATGAWIGVNTVTPNDAVARFVVMGLIPELAGYAAAQREVKYGKEGRSRIDLLLSGKDRDARPCYVEVKNVTMLAESNGAEGCVAAFPDAVTERGRKHLDELCGVVKQGGRAVMFFFLGRGDCAQMRPADEIDPEYGKALRLAATAGVELLAYRMEYSPGGLRVAGKAELEL